MVSAFGEVAAAGISGAHFAEVECRANGGFCSKHGAGSGGWPTVKSFSAAAPGGLPYPRTRDGMVCDELKGAGVLHSYVKRTLALTASSAAAGGGGGGQAEAAPESEL